MKYTRLYVGLYICTYGVHTERERGRGREERERESISRALTFTRGEVRRGEPSRRRAAAAELRRAERRITGTQQSLAGLRAGCVVAVCVYGICVRIQRYGPL